VRLWITLYSGAGALMLLWTGLKTVTIVRITSPLSGVLVAACGALRCCGWIAPSCLGRTACDPLWSG
jgi:hypothetical protein